MSLGRILMFRLLQLFLGNFGVKLLCCLLMLTYFRDIFDNFPNADSGTTVTFPKHHVAEMKDASDNRKHVTLFVASKLQSFERLPNLPESSGFTIRIEVRFLHTRMTIL